MSSVGRLEAFDTSTREWLEYHERILLYFAANDVAEDKRKAVLLTSCGTATHLLLRNLLLPTKLSDATLAAIFVTSGTHFKPKVSEVVTTFKFFSTERQEGEAISNYVAVLNKLVDDCNLGAVRELLVRHQIVCGIDDSGMQTRLLESAELDLETAKKLVMAIEAARKDSLMLCASAMSTDFVQSTNFIEQPIRDVMEQRCTRRSGKHQTSRCQH